MTAREAQNLRDRLKDHGIEAWTDHVVPNDHGYAVVYRGVTRPRDAVALVGGRAVLTPEEGDALLAEIRQGGGLI